LNARYQALQDVLEGRSNIDAHGRDGWQLAGGSDGAGVRSDFAHRDRRFERERPKCHIRKRHGEREPDYVEHHKRRKCQFRRDAHGERQWPGWQHLGDFDSAGSHRKYQPDERSATAVGYGRQQHEQRQPDLRGVNGLKHEHADNRNGQ